VILPSFSPSEIDLHLEAALGQQLAHHLDVAADLTSDEQGVALHGC